MGREPARPTPLGAALAAFLAANPGIANRLGTAHVVDAWPDLVGPQIAAVSRALRVTTDGTLVIEVTTNAWITELSLMERDLLSRVATAPGGEGVRRLHWVLARR